ncbi:MAG: aryl-sulfate sulfohydrolase [Flavobacteriaceae bacterium]|nr:MAG: aryl-sulfate sulfohydrolase [Flavobacteriaceae bacterium]
MSLKYNITAFLMLLVLVIQAQETVSKPNIIYINVDDLGWNDVGYMGGDYYETPVIDNLATEGMSFTDGYAAAANCAPSRACLISGQNTPRHGVYTVLSSERGHPKTRKIIPIKNTKHLTDAQFTMGEMFKKAGYTTGTFGKWHVTKNPLKDGFDVNIGGDHRGNPGREGYSAPYNKLPNLDIADTGENLTDRLTNEAIKFIHDNKNKPFFLYLPYYAVHTPLMGKKHLVEKYQQKAGAQSHRNPIYAAMVENVDTNIGHLLQTLEELNLTDNTLLVFTSDNGGIRSISHQDPLRAGKGSYYEGGTRVPYIIKWPGKIKPNTQSNVPITNLDFFPTFQSVLGLELPNKKLDGVNLMPLLKGKKIAKRALYWHFPIYLQAYNSDNDDGRDPLFRTRPGSTMRYGKWKLHQYFEDGALELYNLKKDLGERHNLAMSHPKKAKELLKKLNAWRQEIKAPIPSEINPKYEAGFQSKQRKIKH